MKRQRSRTLVTFPEQLARFAAALVLVGSVGCQTATPPGVQNPAAASAPVHAPSAEDSQPAALLTPDMHRAASEAPGVEVSVPVVELAPGLRLDRARGRVEFDGILPIDAHNQKTPVVFLEWLVCAPDTKEHESLVLTRVKPSLIHAALLALGLEPGSPGSWDWTGKTLVAKRATGACVRVLVRPAQGAEVDIRSWVRNLKSEQTLASEGLGAQEGDGGGGFVFAGSHIVERGGERWYQADREGGVVGLACFSTELIAWKEMFNPDTGVEEAVWVANEQTVPTAGSSVTVVVERCR